MPRTRTGNFKALRELEIGQEIAIEPEASEGVRQLIKRLKARVAKWSNEGFSYRFKIDGSRVIAQRRPAGQRARYADWWDLEQGEALILKERPTEADIKRAKAAENYMNLVRNDRARSRGEDTGTRTSDFWGVGVDIQGRLIAVRHVKDGKGKLVGINSPAALKRPWDGDWLR